MSLINELKLAFKSIEKSTLFLHRIEITIDITKANIVTKQFISFLSFSEGMKGEYV